jgi:uncharacterized membrane protein required for colicin V production
MWKQISIEGIIIGVGTVIQILGLWFGIVLIILGVAGLICSTIFRSKLHKKKLEDRIQQLEENTSGKVFTKEDEEEKWHEL